MAFNPLPLNGDWQLQKAGPYRNFEIVVRAAPSSRTISIIIFVSYPSKSTLAIAINAARVVLVGNVCQLPEQEHPCYRNKCGKSRSCWK
jgi:hypothetical protein